MQQFLDECHTMNAVVLRHNQWSVWHTQMKIAVIPIFYKAALDRGLQPLALQGLILLIRK
jgi:hypothetical protein